MYFRRSRCSRVLVSRFFYFQQCWTLWQFYCNPFSSGSVICGYFLKSDSQNLNWNGVSGPKRLSQFAAVPRTSASLKVRKQMALVLVTVITLLVCFCSLLSRSVFVLHSTGIYYCKVNNENMRTIWEICLKLTIKTPAIAVSIFNFGQISHIALTLPLLTSSSSSVVYLTLVLNSPVKIYSLIHSNKKIHINKAKYTINVFYIFLHKFYKTVNLIWL